VTAVLAIHACIAEALPNEYAVAGYSVGEMAAWSIAGIWSPQDALRLTDRRARAMDAAGGGGGQLAYMRGLDRRRLEALAADHHCAIAIVNPGKLFVVGGLRDDIVALCDAARVAGAVRAALLDVRIASHTSRLSAAVGPFHDALKNTAIADPKPGRILLAGGNGARIFRAQEALRGLAAQVANPIDWAATLEALVEVGVDRILDLGPGHALADLARAALPQPSNYAAGAFHSLDGLREWIASA
jgi:[acyl-carrier-protein] S-malonyltransferase